MTARVESVMSTGSAASGWTADEAVTHLYSGHYGALVRLATMLLGDQGRAEEVVQDAYVSLHERWGRLADPDKALAYLRTSVMNGARSQLRRRSVAARHQAVPPDPVGSAESSVLAAEQRRELLAALDALSDRQREVLLLRYYLDLSEADIADTLRISRGAVKSHSSRGIAALRTTWRHS
jgi:RNA polymerase sigma-70 factor (sigma-E family)